MDGRFQLDGLAGSVLKLASVHVGMGSLADGCMKSLIKLSLKQFKLGSQLLPVFLLCLLASCFCYYCEHTDQWLKVP